MYYYLKEFQLGNEVAFKEFSIMEYGLNFTNKMYKAQLKHSTRLGYFLQHMQLDCMQDAKLLVAAWSLNYKESQCCQTLNKRGLKNRKGKKVDIIKSETKHKGQNEIKKKQ